MPRLNLYWRVGCLLAYPALSVASIVSLDPLLSWRSCCPVLALKATICEMSSGNNLEGLTVDQRLDALLEAQCEEARGWTRGTATTLTAAQLCPACACHT